MMNLRLLAISIAVGFVAVIDLPAVAVGDELYGFVQIACVPEIGYFSIRKFQVYNLPNKAPFLTEGFVAW